ncbi:hypothetical protein [Lactiplantibacillus carotarum]|uniref:hypothetical protein n=1 Tax=Lactiplantibacillus carotarum TaxID=2993456 RepID=UPI00298F289D|nr:hypothetical protein [Lactiplantibacillus carotarum]
MIEWHGLSAQQVVAVQAVCLPETQANQLTVTCRAANQGEAGVKIKRDGDQASLIYGSTADLMRGPLY